MRDAPYLPPKANWRQPPIDPPTIASRATPAIAARTAARGGIPDRPAPVLPTVRARPLRLDCAFLFTWLGACTALVQIVTPNRMRGRVSAIYLFVINLISLGLGPTAVALATDHLFGADVAIGKALALVAIVSLGLAIGFLQSARRAVPDRVMAIRSESGFG